MKSLIALSLVAWLAAGTLAKTVQGAAVNSESEPVLQWHCLGASRLLQLPEAAKLKSISEMLESKRLAEQVLGSLAGAPRRWIQRDVSSEEKSALRPLLQDLVQVETVGEVRPVADSSHDLQYTIGLKLTEDQSSRWDRALRYLMASWKMGAIELREQEGYRGWEIPKEHDNFYLMRSGQWLFIGWGYQGLSSQTKAWKLLAQRTFPESEEGRVWLNAQFDCARLVRTSSPPPVKSGWCALPRIDLLLANTNDNVRTLARLTYPEDQNWKLDPWRIPSKTIAEPLISFTAVRGIATDLEKCDALKSLEINPMPNQLFIWAQGEIPFQTFMAAPVRGVTNLLERMAARLPSLVFSNWLAQPMGNFQFNKNNTELIWTGLPVVVPSLRSAIEPAGEYLLGGVFPPSPNTNPPPAELLSEITTRKDLIYYDWEITEERLKQVRILGQLWDIIFKSPLAPPVSAPASGGNQEWLLAVGKHLGNTITQVRVSSPRELSLIRRSHLGFTGMELVFLTRWLDDPQFPFTTPLKSWSQKGPEAAPSPK